MALYDGAIGAAIDAFASLPGVGPKGAQRITFYLLKADEQKAETLSEAILDLKHKVRFCAVCGNICESTVCSICRNPARDGTLLCVVQEPKDVFSIERTQQYRGLYHVLGGVIDPMNGVRPQDLRIAQLLARLGPRGARTLDQSAASATPVTGGATPRFVERSDAGFAGNGIYTSLAPRHGTTQPEGGVPSDGGDGNNDGNGSAPATSPLAWMADGPQVKEVILALDQDIEGDATTSYLSSRLASYGVTVSRLASGLPAGSDLEYADEETLARAFQGRHEV